MKIEDMTLCAWVGEDELGSGRIGLKQGLVPAGMIPLVTVADEVYKIGRHELREAMEAQAAKYGKKIRLVRFRFDLVLDETVEGK
jgi:hypothetical protein